MHKKSSKKYGHLPEKEAEAEPWDKLCEDLIGPYVFKCSNKKDLTLWCVTMIDPATGGFEMRAIPSKQPDIISNIVEQTWFTRYPWPTQIIVDKGSEFLAEFTQLVTHDYGIKKRVITTRNPQANAVLEQIHQTIGNIIRTFDLDEVDEEDPWSGVLAATMFAVRATYHTTLQATPSQCVFGRDAILNIPFSVNWEKIKEQKQNKIKNNNKKENSKRIPHVYRIGDRVLLKTAEPRAKYDPHWEGPHTVIKVNNNGTVRIDMGTVQQTVNIRNINPYNS